MNTTKTNLFELLGKIFFADFFLDTPPPKTSEYFRNGVLIFSGEFPVIQKISVHKDYRAIPQT